MNYAYARVSTDYQEHDRQKEILKGYDIKQENYFFEIISGGKAAKKRPVFEQMFKKVKEGDTIYFTEMSRMGRSTKDLIDTVDELVNNGVSVVFIKENLRIGSAFETDPVSTLIFHIFASFSQFERELISQRVKDGLKAKKAEGVQLGRPTDDTKRNEVIELLKQNLPQKEIASRLGCTQPYVSMIRKNYLANLEETDDNEIYDL